MTSPDRAADEAIALRSYYLDAGTPHPDPDTEIARRVGRLLDFTETYPELDQLAEHRLTALARLAAKGVTPDPGCTVRVAHTPIIAEADPAPCEHRYAIHKVTPASAAMTRIGTAWLSTEPDTRGLYEAVRLGIRGSVRGSTLFEAVERLALLIDTEDRARRDARRGAVQ